MNPLVLLHATAASMSFTPIVDAEPSSSTALVAAFDQTCGTGELTIQAIRQRADAGGWKLGRALTSSDHNYDMIVMTNGVGASLSFGLRHPSTRHTTVCDVQIRDVVPDVLAQVSRYLEGARPNLQVQAKGLSVFFVRRDERGWHSVAQRPAVQRTSAYDGPYAIVVRDTPSASEISITD